jgi:hypothetical protein
MSVITLGQARQMIFCCRIDESTRKLRKSVRPWRNPPNKTSLATPSHKQNYSALRMPRRRIVPIPTIFVRDCIEFSQKRGRPKSSPGMGINSWCTGPYFRKWPAGFQRKKLHNCGSSSTLKWPDLKRRKLPAGVAQRIGFVVLRPKAHRFSPRGRRRGRLVHTRPLPR